MRRVMSQMEDWLFDAFLIFENVLFPQNRELTAQTEKQCLQIRERGDCIRMKDMEITGNDLLKAGIKPGKAIGETLSRLFAAVLEEPERNSREKLLSMALETEND